jgi:HEAT repeat protein
VPALIYCLSASDRYLLLSATWTLGNYAKFPEKVVPILISQAANGENDWSVKEAAVEALGDYGPAAAAAKPLLLRIFHETYSVISVISDDAGHALIRIDESATGVVTEKYLKIAEDASVSIQVRRHALESQRELGKYASSAVPALQVLVHNENQTIAYFASEALQAIDMEAAVKAGLDFRPLFTEIDWRTYDAHHWGTSTNQIEAIRAFEKLGISSPPTISVLRQALGNSDARVRREAAVALKKLAPAETAKAGVK